MNSLSDLITVLPECILASLVMLLLLYGAWHAPQRSLYRLTQMGLGVASLAILFTFNAGVGYAFHDLVVQDPLGQISKLLLLFSTAVVLNYSQQSNQKLLCAEYYALLVSAVIGMMVMCAGANLLTLYMGLELSALSLYALIALERDNAIASEAAIKYFVLGALASGILLYGISLLYGMSGSLNLNAIQQALSQGQHISILTLAVIFILAGLAFKLGAVPFHIWIPDVYSGSPTPITLFIGSVSKIAAFMFSLRLLFQGMPSLFGTWQPLLITMAVLSVFLGNTVALMQTQLKRLLAYSAIAHTGFMLYGLMSVTLNGVVSAFFYLISYVLMSLAGLGVLLLLSREKRELQTLDDLNGLNQQQPWLAFLLLIVLLSLAGIPPTLGFYAKFMVLQAALQAGHTLAVIWAVLLTVVGAFYYLRLIQRMYFYPPSAAPIMPSTQGSHRHIWAINAIALLILGIIPQVLIVLSAFGVVHSLS